MDIGKNIHTANKKKAYRKPVLEVVEVDRDIILMFTSIENQDPVGVASNSENTITNKSSKENEVFPNSQEPFGGSSPDYER